MNAVFKYNSSVLTLAVIEQDNPTQLEEICTIFEKLNSTGVNLNVFDLLTARLYPKGVHIHRLWENAIESSNVFSQFSNVEQSAFGLLILRFIALYRRSDVKSKALINLSHQDFESHWNLAVTYFEEAYSRLIALNEDGYGVFIERWLPSTTMIPVLAALLQKRDSLEASKQAQASEAIRWWYWGSVFTVRYTGPVETVSQRDYTEMSQFFGDSSKYPEVFRNVYSEVVREQSDFSLLEVERTTNTLYKGVMCLLARNGARDFRQNESIAFSHLEDHHVFPQSYVKANRPDSILGLTGTTLYNNIVNRTLISASTNRAIGKKAPSIYLADEKIIVQDGKSDLLRQHFVDDAGLTALEADDYERFLKSRHTVILNTIRMIFMDMPKPPGIGEPTETN